jgi:hypothetical protein
MGHAVASAGRGVAGGLMHAAEQHRLLHEQCVCIGADLRQLRPGQARRGAVNVEIELNGVAHASGSQKNVRSPNEGYVIVQLVATDPSRARAAFDRATGDKAVSKAPDRWLRRDLMGSVPRPIRIQGA